MFMVFASCFFWPTAAARVVPRPAPVLDLQSLLGVAALDIASAGNGFAHRGKEGRYSSTSRIDSTGQGALGDSHANKESYALKVVTVNSTAWGPAKKFLLVTDANVIFLQEHRLVQGAIAEASRWAEAQGWSSIWGPAEP